MPDPRLTGRRSRRKPAERKVSQLGDGTIAGKYLLQSDDHGVCLGSDAAGMELPSPVLAIVGDVEDGLP